MRQISKGRGGSAARRARWAGQLHSNPSGGRITMTKSDWLQAAIEELSLHGIEGVKVLPLSAKLGVSRGSFYWHFQDREELLRSLLAFWEEELTDSVIEQSNAMGGTPRQQVEEVLTNVLVNRRNRYDTAVAAWGMSDQHAAKRYARVLRKRLKFLTSILGRAGINREDAEFRTRMLLGYLQFTEISQGRRSAAQQVRDVDRCSEMLFG